MTQQQHDNYKPVTVRLSPREQAMLADLLEHYRLPSYADVLRSALHSMHFKMQQEQPTQDDKDNDIEMYLSSPARAICFQVMHAEM